MKAAAIQCLGLAALAACSPLLNEVTARDNDAEVSSRSYYYYQRGFPFRFTSTYSVYATPDLVVDSNNTFTGGLSGASGHFLYGINAEEDVICYNITIFGFQGEYQSPARTATHIHEAGKGLSGPPRIAFPNPVETTPGVRNSIGCLRGSFETGLLADNVDTGTGFRVQQIEDNPAGFFTDVHSSLAVPGAVRGQLC